MRPTGWPGLAFRRWLAAAIVLAAIAVSMTGVAGGWASERTLASPSSVSAEYPVSQPVFGRATATAGFPAAAAIGGVSLVAWQEESAVVGTLVSPSGKVLIRLGIAVAPGGGQAPDVAAGAGQYLVAWSGDNVVQAVRVSTAGVVLDPAPIQVGGAKLMEPGVGVAFDGTDYLVTWEQRSSLGGGGTIRAARVDQSGTVLDPVPLHLSIGVDDEALDVAFDGTNFLVVWQDRSGGWDLLGTRVAPDGTILDPGSLPIVTGRDDQTEPSLAWSGIEYLVAFTNTDRGGSGNVLGSRVKADGSVLDPAGFPIFVGPNDQHSPAVDFDGTNFLVAWDDQALGGGPVSTLAARVAEDATVLDPQGLKISPPGQGTTPGVVWNGTAHLVLYSAQELFARRVTPDGVVHDAGGIPIAFGADGQSWAATASDGTNLLSVWLDLRYVAGRGYRSVLMAARVDGSGQSLDGTGIPLSGILPQACCSFDAAWNGSDYLVVWTESRGASYVVRAVRISADGVVLDPSPIPIAADSGSPMVAVASNGQNALVTWMTPADIWDVMAAIVDPDGTVSTPVVVSTVADINGGLDVGSDGTEYLAVWSVNYALSDVVGARLDATGQLLDASPITIAAASSLQWQPRVSSGSDPYLVTWEDWRSYSTNADEVYGARVSSAGTVLDPAGIGIAATTADELHPSAAWDGTDWVATWRSATWPFTTVTVDWVRIAPDGTIQGAPAVLVTAASPVLPEAGAFALATVGVAYGRLVAGPPDNAVRLFVRFISE